MLVRNAQRSIRGSSTLSWYLTLSFVFVCFASLLNRFVLCSAEVNCQWYAQPAASRTTREACAAGGSTSTCSTRRALCGVSFLVV